MMNDPAALGMIPFDTIGLYEQPKPRFIFKMPRVVPDQKNKFETDDLFKKLSRDSEVSISDVTNFERIRNFVRMISSHDLQLKKAVVFTQCLRI